MDAKIGKTEKNYTNIKGLKMAKMLYNQKELETAKQYISMFGPGIRDFLIKEVKLHPTLIDDLIAQAQEQYDNTVRVYKTDDEVIDEDGIKAVLVTFENGKPVKKYIKIKNDIEKLKEFLRTDEIEIMDLGFEVEDSPYIAVVDKKIQNQKGIHWFSIEYHFAIGNVLVFKKGLKEVNDIEDIKIEYEGLYENLDEIIFAI